MKQRTLSDYKGILLDMQKAHRDAKDWQTARMFIEAVHYCQKQIAKIEGKVLVKAACLVMAMIMLAGGCATVNGLAKDVKALSNYVDDSIKDDAGD